MARLSDVRQTSHAWGTLDGQFVTGLFAARVPVLPFAFLPLSTARIVSLVLTSLLLLALGVGRGIIGHKNLVTTALQTPVSGAAAAAAGLVVGKLVTGSITGS